MTDIVGRLRLDAEPTESDMEEAATEIERLRAEINKLQLALRSIADYCDEAHREPFDNISDAARAALKEETAP